MNQAPEHKLGNNDWSFGPHSVADGDPMDYPGIPVMDKDEVDTKYWEIPINYYMTVYRKGEFVWGYSPSKQEQSTKKTHYEMVSQVTSPLNNPTQDYIRYERTIKSVDVTGWAKITPVDGKINDIWVNGVSVANPSALVKWNAEKQWYDFTIPVSVQSGRNPVDITIFGGPSEDCVDCYGCANSTHSFYIDFVGAKQYPSSIKLVDLSNNEIGDTVQIDTTVFNIIVTDRNGNLKGSYFSPMRYIPLHFLH
jgi:hypothetical protein